MQKEIVINVTARETRVALLEDRTIAELFIERESSADIAGNIYKGKVQRVLPGIQAAFVDIGLGQAAFIYVDDVLRTGFDDIEAAMMGGVDTDPPEPLPDGEGAGGQRNGMIGDILSEGQDIMVHVAKPPIGSKGPRVTSYVSLPGRFLVLMPYANHIGVSRRIEEEEERSRLKSIVADMRTNHFGYIVRTAAEGMEGDLLRQEMTFLNNLWETVQARYEKAPSPSMIHKELSLSLRAVRDLLIHDAARLVVDSRAVYREIQQFLDDFMPGFKDRVELHDGREPIFEAFNLEGDISRAIKRKVWLKSGGYIVIEQTEALTAIDVNTGRYVGKHNLEETIVKTNLEAVKEIAYQIRLRDIGGIIIIDFIDMEKKANQEKVYGALKEALRKDRNKTHVLPMSDMGLIQMTRKRVKKPLNRVLCEPCFYCEGEGYLVSRETICYHIFRDILRECQDAVGGRIAVKVNPEIAELLHGEQRELIAILEKSIGKQVVIYPNDSFHLEQVDIIDVLKE
jgi:ribonuclease G